MLGSATGAKDAPNAGLVLSLSPMESGDATIGMRRCMRIRAHMVEMMVWGS